MREQKLLYRCKESWSDYFTGDVHYCQGLIYEFYDDDTCMVSTNDNKIRRVTKAAFFESFELVDNSPSIIL